MCTLQNQMTDADHVKAFRLFEVARGESVGNDFQLEAWENDHLQQCVECRGVVNIFAIGFSRRSAKFADVPIRRFNVGDRVQIVGPGDHRGKRGLVTEVVEANTGDFVCRYRVRFLDGGSGTFFGFEFALDP
jgi:hypothetical protein